MKPVALIDMDGTVADYSGAMAEAMMKLRSPGETTVEGSDSHLVARRHLIKSQPGFWLNLRRLELGFDILEAVIACGYEPHVLTKGPEHVPSAWQEKVAWGACLSKELEKSAKRCSHLIRRLRCG